MGVDLLLPIEGAEIESLPPLTREACKLALAGGHFAWSGVHFLSGTRREIAHVVLCHESAEAMQEDSTLLDTLAAGGFAPAQETWSKQHSFWWREYVYGCPYREWWPNAAWDHCSDATRMLYNLARENFDLVLHGFWHCLFAFAVHGPFEPTQRLMALRGASATLQTWGVAWPVTNALRKQREKRTQALRVRLREIERPGALTDPAVHLRGILRMCLQYQASAGDHFGDTLRRIVREFVDESWLVEVWLARSSDLLRLLIPHHGGHWTDEGGFGWAY